MCAVDSIQCVFQEVLFVLLEGEGPLRGNYGGLLNEGAKDDQQTNLWKIIWITASRQARGQRLNHVLTGTTGMYISIYYR